jgi:hypothetical protein
MSAVDGVPVDKCPKCGSDVMYRSPKDPVIKFWCDSIVIDHISERIAVHSVCCESISRLQADVKYWRDLATLMQDTAVERGNKLFVMRGKLMPNGDLEK